VNGWDTAACQRLLEDAAVALLTRQRLPAQVRTHAELCPPCRDEIAGMAQLPPRLALAVDRQLVAAAEPSPELLPRLLAEVDRRRTRRRWTTMGVAAAAVAAAVAVGATVGMHLPGPGSPAAAGPAVSSVGATRPPSPVEPSVSPAHSSGTGQTRASGPGQPVFAEAQGWDQATGARAEVAVLAGNWGSRVQVEVYDVPAETECRMVVVDRHGKRAEAGSWVVPSGGYSPDGQQFSETVSIRPADIALVEIVDNRTQRLMMQLKVHRA
jgi:hypothetical protein